MYRSRHKAPIKRYTIEIALFVLSLALIGSSFFIPGDAVSMFGFSTFGKLRIASKWAVLISGVLSISLNTMVVFTDRRATRTRNLLMLFNSLVLVMGALTWATAGGRMDMVGLTAQSLHLCTPIALGALSGILCERSGVINIGIEGMMLMAACLGFTAALYFQSLWVGLLASVAGGMLMAALHAVLSIRFCADQIISGTVINILAIGATGFIRSAFLIGSPLTPPGVFPVISVPGLSDIPILGKAFFIHQPMVYTMLLLTILIHIGLFYTRWGLRTRAIGENPTASDSLGVDVLRFRYVNLLMSGAVAGLGGAWFSLEMVGNFELFMTGGKGFIALAAMIFGKWNPFGALGGALLFGFTDALQIKLQMTMPAIPYQFLGMMPYIITMAVLAGFVGKAKAPSAVGVPYFPEK